MDNFVHLFNSYAFTLLVAAALCWLCVRAYQVLSKPADELINLLGLEVPAAPTVSLAGVKSDGVILHWKAGDQEQPKFVGITYQVHLNGISIAEVSPQEPVISIIRLRPDHGYIVRLVTVAVGGFSASSEPLQVQTKSASSNDFFHDHSETDDPSNAVPLVQPYKGQRDPGTPSAPSMSREQSNSQSQHRRAAAAGRRSTIGNASDQIVDGGQHSPGVEADLKELTLQLEHKRDEAEKLQQQVFREDEDFTTSKVDLEKRKAELKNQANAKEGGSKDQKRLITQLEQSETAAKTARSSAEKQLQQKRQTREKLKSDVVVWDKQIQDLHADAKRLEEVKANYQAETDEKIAELRAQAATQLADNSRLEDAIKDQKFQIRDLEQDSKSLSDDRALEGADEHTAEDHAWSQRLGELHAKYHNAWRQLEEARSQHQEMMNQTRMWDSMRVEQPQLFIPQPPMDIMPSRRTSLHRGRSSSLRNELSAQATPFEASPVTTAAYTTGMTSMIPPFASSSSFFNMGNGTAITPTRTFSTLSAVEADPLSGGGMTSPGTLLPANLLNDDNDPATDLLPGLGAPETLEHAQQEPTSPASVQSRSPSVFTSPQNSTPHLPVYHATDIGDSDGRSIRSTTGSSRAVSLSNNTAGSRFTHFFGFNRQRGKTFSDEGPVLGSLKQTEAHSFPRDHGSNDQSGHIRRSSQSASSWNLLLSNRNATAGAESSDAAGIRKHFNPFKVKTDTWPTMGSDKPPSPRPGSTHSMDNGPLPRPGAAGESHFGWPNKAFGQRHSPLAAPDWSAVPVAGPWSRHPSRRPSVQYSSGLPIGAETFLADTHDDVLQGAEFDINPSGESPKQAPIGTRPKSSSAAAKEEAAQAAANRLNPNAPSFKTLFSGKKADKSSSDASANPAEPKKKRGRRGKNLSTSSANLDAVDVADTPATSNGIGNGDHSFHGPDISVELANAYPSTPGRAATAAAAAGRDPNNNISKTPSYAQSISTTTDLSTASPRTSLDTSLKSPTAAEQMLDPPGSATRESFMQRLSRKSSASMFALGGRLKKSNNKAAEAESSTHGATDETDEEGTSTSGLLSPNPFSSVANGFAEGAAPGMPPPTARQKSGFSLRLKGRKKEKGTSVAGDDEDVAADE